MREPLKIVYKHDHKSFGRSWIRGITDSYLAFEPWDCNRTYTPGTILYLGTEYNYRRNSEELAQLADSGFRVIIDQMWECNPGAVANAHIIHSDRFFWYNESLHYTHLGYDQYQPGKDVVYRALMPMNRRKAERDEFIQRMDLTGIMWSYVESGTQLPWDRDMADFATQRYFDPRWYDLTYASVVVESIVDFDRMVNYRPAQQVFITEKTMKPLAFQHPFIVYGLAGTLSTLRSWGFCTFDNLWSESYDNIVAGGRRRDAVVELVGSVEIKDYDPETQRRITHNRNHFFNKDLVRSGFIRDIVEPILNYAETR